MSSFTSKTVRDLYEAYNSVYIDETELFLNDLLDTVTESVNELVNEGYDLSDYSWDEIYESFLENVLEPELQEVESFITQLNESAEELTEEQIGSLLQERFGFLSGLANLIKGRQAVQTATQTATRAPKPSIIQAAPVKLKPTTPTPTPSSNPLYAPGVSSGRPAKPTITPPPGADKGSFARFGDWLNSFTSKGRAQQAAKPPAPTQPPSPKPPATPPASRQPSGTPQRQQGWPSIGLRDKVSRVTQALTPGPRVKGVAKGLLKYGVAPTAAAVVGTGGLLGGAIDVKRAASGQSSVTQRLGGATVGGIGNLAKTAASVAAATPGIKDTGTPRELQQTGQYLKNIGSNIQKDVDVKRAKELRAQPSPSTQRPKKLFPEGLSIENVISEGPDWKSAPKPKGIAVLTLGKERKVYIPGQGWQFPATARKWARAQGYEDWDKIPNPAQPAKPKKDPVTQPVKPKKDPVTQPVKPKKDPVTQPPKPKQDPVTQPPVKPTPTPTPPPKGDDRGGRTAPPVRQPASQASPVTQYMKAAAAARKSGDPAEMARVRDMGLQIWASTPANKKLAAAAAERERIRGTAQTDNPLMRDMKSRLPLTTSVQAPAVKSLGRGQQSLAQNPNAAIGATPKPATTTPATGSALSGKQTGTAFSGTALSSAKPTGASNMSRATVTNAAPVAYKPELMKDKGSGLNPPSNTVLDTKSQVLKTGPLKKGDPGWANNARYNVQSSYEYDAYELVLEYLISNGHADTLEEANYVMMQMSSEHIQNIVENYK